MCNSGRTTEKQPENVARDCTLNHTGQTLTTPILPHDYTWGRPQPGNFLGEVPEPALRPFQRRLV